MTQEQIIEGNKLIEEFMGIDIPLNNNDSVYIEIHSRPTTFDGITDPFDSWYRPEEFEYHESWDWLMPVINKIPSNMYSYFEKGSYILSVGTCLMVDVSNVYWAFREVVEFIKWYNNESK